MRPLTGKFILTQIFAFIFQHSHLPSSHTLLHGAELFGSRPCRTWHLGSCESIKNSYDVIISAEMVDAELRFHLEKQVVSEVPN